MATILYWQDPDSGQTEFVQFDAVLSEVHEDTVSITEHPVEIGVNVTDHARPEPERLALEVVVTSLPNLAVDTDLVYEATELSVSGMRDLGTRQIPINVARSPITPSLAGLARAGLDALAGAITGPPLATVESEPERQTLVRRASMLRQREPRNRIRDVYDLLLKVANNSIVVTVASAHREHFDMLIERLADPRTVDKGSAAHFEIDLKRISVAESETVEAPKPAEPRAQTTKPKGSQSPKETPKQAYVSAAKRLKDLGYEFASGE